MGFIKGTCIGMSIGIAVGMALGIIKYDCLEDLFSRGKREIKRFRRKYIV